MSKSFKRHLHIHVIWKPQICKRPSAQAFMRLSALAPGDVAAMPKGLSKLVRQPAPESALEVFLDLARLSDDYQP